MYFIKTERNEKFKNQTKNKFSIHFLVENGALGLCFYLSSFLKKKETGARINDKVHDHIICNPTVRNDELHQKGFFGLKEQVLIFVK